MVLKALNDKVQRLTFTNKEDFMIRRIVYFLGLNFVLLMTFSLIMSVLPVPPGYYTQMIILYGLFGYGGALISLMLSRKMAKWSKKITLLNANSSDAQEAWLVKTVYQYARMSNIKVMPEVGIYQGDELNAFATGPTKNRSLVAVSSGLLNNMTKDEVEGVLGHEIAHIKNGDMVTMVLLQGTINTLVMFASRILSDIVASKLSRDGERGNFWVRMALYQVFAMALGVLGMVVQGTFSRHREFRADAGGARLAGPDKMVKSLQKLQSFYDPKQQKASRQEPIAALQISGYFRKSTLAQLLSTHPPLEKRIAALKKRQL